MRARVHTAVSMNAVGLVLLYRICCVAGWSQSDSAGAHKSARWLCVCFVRVGSTVCIQ